MRLAQEDGDGMAEDLPKQPAGQVPEEERCEDRLDGGQLGLNRLFRFRIEVDGGAPSHAGTEAVEESA